MSRPKIEYKGYIIHPTTMRLADAGEWNHEVHIARDKGYEIVDRKFSSGTTFKTEEEAVQHCINYASQIIDGEVPNCSVYKL